MIVRRKGSAALQKGKHFLENRRKTENKVKELDFTEPNDDLFKSRTKSSFDIEDPIDRSFLGKA